MWVLLERESQENIYISLEYDSLHNCGSFVSLLSHVLVLIIILSSHQFYAQPILQVYSGLFFQEKEMKKNTNSWNITVHK